MIISWGHYHGAELSTYSSCQMIALVPVSANGPHYTRLGFFDNFNSAARPLPTATSYVAARLPLYIVPLTKSLTLLLEAHKTMLSLSVRHGLYTLFCRTEQII